MQIRLNKFIAESGACSRREADRKIAAGHVKVGEITATLGTMVNPEIDQVFVDENLINSKSSSKHTYFAVYKPKGIISSSSDEKGRDTVVDLVKSEKRVYPVGRLDKDSEGLMILTNDGELTNTLTHPKNEHEKEYVIYAKPKEFEYFNEKAITDAFLKGLRIEGKLMKADKISIKKTQDTKYYLLNTILHTGYNRQLRKMCDKMNLDIKKLIRVRVGKLELKKLNLKPGEYKKIRKEDII